MTLNCGLAAWTVRLFSAFVLVECVFVLVFGAAGWTAYLTPPEPAGDEHAAAAAAYGSGDGGGAGGHGVGDGASARRFLAAGSAAGAELLVATVAARQEGAHAAMLLEHVYQFGFCAMCFVVNELSSGRAIPRVLVFFLVASYASATAGIAAWLVPAGYSEDKAQTEVLAVGAVEFVMLVLLCCDCCGGHEERLKSGHHKSRLSSRCPFAKWVVRGWCLLLMGQATLIVGFGRPAWDNDLGTPGVLTTLNGLKQRVWDLEAANVNLHQQLSTCQGSGATSSSSGSSSSSPRAVYAPSAMPSFYGAPSTMPSVFGAPAAGPATRLSTMPSAMPVAAPLPSAMPVAAPALAVAVADGGGKGGGGINKGGGGINKGGGKGDAEADGGEEEAAAAPGGDKGDGPNWDLLAQLTGSGAYADDGKKDEPDKKGDSGEPPPPPASAARNLAAALEAPADPPAVCLGGTAACAAWAAKREGARAGMLLAQVFQAGLCATAVVVNELGTKAVQRAVLFFLMATFAAAAAGVYAFLVPIGFDEDAAAAETAQGVGVACGLFVLLCLDCYLSRDGGCCDGQSDELKELKKFHAIPKDEESAVKSERSKSEARSEN